jgi:hypothetical protein
MLKNCGVPRWEEYPHTPGVFVRVANAGLTGYGTWKSVRRMGDRSVRGVENVGWARIGCDKHKTI